MYLRSAHVLGAYLEEEVWIEGNVVFLRQDPVEGAGAQEDEHVGGEQRGRGGRAVRARAAILEEHLQPQQGQHALGWIQDEAAPATAHAGPHLQNRRDRHEAETAFTRTFLSSITAVLYRSENYIFLDSELLASLVS